MSLSQTIKYKVAQHVFELRAKYPGLVMKLLPSYNAFFLEQEVQEESLFVAQVVGELSLKGKEIFCFDWDNAQCKIYRDAQGDYAFALQRMNCADTYIMHASSDFKCLKMALYGVGVEDAFALNNFLMMGFAFASASQQTLMIHASVIRNAGHGYLFLGVSGTGKSTHSDLWLECVPGSELLNDDNPIIRLFAEDVVVFGSPWSGKTPCYRNTSAPIGALVRLHQAPTNNIVRLPPIQGFAQVLSSCSLMKWDKMILDGITETVSQLSMVVPIFELKCLPDADAASLCYNTVTHGAGQD